MAKAQTGRSSSNRPGYGVLEEVCTRLSRLPDARCTRYFGDVSRHLAGKNALQSAER
jgi:hypothetical protein